MFTLAMTEEDYQDHFLTALHENYGNHFTIVKLKLMSCSVYNTLERYDVDI